jgi:hypothetical protein
VDEVVGIVGGARAGVSAGDCERVGGRGYPAAFNAVRLNRLPARMRGEAR